MARITREQLAKLQKKFKTDSAIGTIFGISRQAVHQLRIKFRIPSLTEKNKDRNFEMQKLFENGYTGTEVAKKFSLSVSQTYRVIKEIQKKQKKNPKP